MPTYRRTFPGLPEEIHKARRFIRQCLDGSPVAADAGLIVSELATNALRHTASGSPAGDSNVQARQIRLQSTLMGGPRPAALVNGQMVREGDVVATGSGASRTSYRVLKIEARRVILEREGIRSEVPLE